MDEEIKDVGEMATIEDEEEIAIEEDYTALEAETIIIDDDSNIQTDAEYEQAVAQKELADEAREALSAVLLSVLEKGEINDDDIAEIAAQQEIYTENVTALKILGLTAGDEKSTAGKSTTNVITSNIDYDELMKVLAEKADWLYTDENGQVMLNGEVVPKIKVVELEAEKIKADVGEFKDLTTENFTAINAKIDNLEVGDLTAVNADITNLKALVAEIQTLIGGNLTMDNIQSLVLTADKVTIANALIKNAMIDSISANKITMGTINTNNVNIQSADGSMIINGTTQQFKDKNNKVRIQIGKDAQSNFTFALFSQDGVGVLIDENGIKSGAVPDGLIVNDMVADNANISGGKLDINSVITSINNGTEVIKGTRVQLDEQGQSLEVAFNQLKTKVETIENVTIEGDLSSIIEQVTTNTTNISVMQGQISSLISNTTITKQDGTVTQLKDEFNSVKDTVSSHTQTINSLQTNYKTTLKTTTTEYYVSTSNTGQTGGNWSEATPTWTAGKYIWQRMKYTYSDNSVKYSTPVCIQGAKGDKGDKGDKGETGKDGTSINILGSLSSTSQLPSTGHSGDCYIIGGDLHVWSATTNKWENCGKIKGEPGDSAYFHIKYSNDLKTFTANGGEDVGIYIGILTDGNKEDSMTFSDYKWSRFKGEQGIQGDTGEKGQSLTKSTPQWYASTSNTTQTGGSWVESMPTIDSSHYLWLRYKLNWENPTATTYTTPTLEQVTESVKEVSAKQSKLEQDLDGFKLTVSNTYATQSTTNSMLSQIQQNANSISTKVNVNGVISSINQSSETIAINANKINLNGYVSNDDANWSIDNEGNMRAENLKIEGEVGADTLSVNYIDNPCYPATLAGSIDLYVNAYSGNDDYTIDDILQSYDEAEEKNNDSLKKKFETIQGAIDAIPKFLNNKTVHITMETNSTEDVYIRGATSGAIRLYMNGKTLYGTLRGYVCSATVTVYGGTKDSTEGAVGIIHPNVGIAFAGRAVSVGFEACQYVALYKLKIYAPDAIPGSITNTDKVCVASQSGTGNVYCKNIQIVNAVVGFRANNTGVMHVNTSSGIARKYGFQSTTGGIISLANNSQAGGKTSATNKSAGGQIWHNADGPTFAAGDQTTDTTTAPSTSTTKTMTIKSSYGDTYRSSVYNNWKKDGTARQGDYGYGDCTGCWFFGSAFAELKGKTISKVQITITRNSGGSYSAVGLVVRTHNYSARPSGAPTLSSSSYGTLSLKTGQTDKLTITNSTVLNGISNGTVKGFGIRTTYDSAHYAVCSGSVTVKITYTE